MKIELANGDIIKDPDQKKVRTILESLNINNNDHAILQADNGDYLQTAIIENAFLAEYSTSDGYFKSENENLSIAVIQDAFSKFLSGENEWEKGISWIREDLPGEQTNETSSAGRNIGGETNLVDNILNSVKANVKHSIKKKIGNFFKF